MENLQGLMDNIPPVSRVWTVCVIGVQGAVALKLVSPFRLIFVPEQAFSHQPWRLVSSFFFFGDLSISTALAIWNTLLWLRSMEEWFHVDQGWFPDAVNGFNEVQMAKLNKSVGKLKPFDFAYFLVLICGSIVAMATIGTYMFGHRLSILGFVLYEVLSYIACRTRSDIQLSIFGLINVTGVYIPFFAPVLDWVTQESFKDQYSRLVTGHFEVLKELFTSHLAWKSACGLALGHWWWFVSQILLTKVYQDTNRERGRLRTRTVKRVEQHRAVGCVDVTKALVRMVLLPPWYWAVIYGISRS